MYLKMVYCFNCSMQRFPYFRINEAKENMLCSFTLKNPFISHLFYV